MVTNSVLLELVGYAAGVLGVAANAPQIFDLFLHPEKALQQNLPRNIILSISNMLWMTYGIIIKNFPVIIMCGIATFFLVMITLFVLRARLVH